MMEEDEDTRDFCKVDSETGNPSHYLADLFQEDRIFAIISALLDSRAAVNVLSSSMADSMGLERRVLRTEDFNLRAPDGGQREVTGVAEVAITVGNHPVKDIVILVSPNLSTSDLILSCRTMIELGVLDFSKCSHSNKINSIFAIEEKYEYIPPENAAILQNPPHLRKYKDIDCLAP